MTGPALGFVVREACPACGSREVEARFRQGFAEGETWAFLQRYYEGRIARERLGEATYAIEACRACGLHYQREVLDGPGLGFLYETAISAKASLAKREGAAPAYFAGLSRNARRIFALVPAGRARDVRVLDFGMGWGHWAAAAKALGCSVQGAEISAARIAFAATLGVPAVDPATLEDGSLDYVHADQVFEHLVEPAEALEGLARLLRPGGVVRIAVPNGQRTAARLARGWTAAKDELQPLEHLNAFTAAALDAMAARAGLQRVGEPLRRRLAQWAEHRGAAPGGYYRKPG